MNEYSHGHNGSGSTGTRSTGVFRTTESAATVPVRNEIGLVTRELPMRNGGRP